MDACEVSVQKVVSAFQIQSDLEKDARLQRKNLQVIDRLAKVQAHKRRSIIMLRDSYGSNQLAKEAADSLFTKVSHIVSSTDAGIQPSHMVPLLVCRIMSLGSSGSIYVTAHHIILITQFVPLVGGSKIFCFKINDIKLSPYESAIGLPTGLSIHKKSEGSEDLEPSHITFAPSIGAKRFHSFIDIVNTVNVEDPMTLQLTSRGGILYLQDDEAHDDIRVNTQNDEYIDVGRSEYVAFNRAARSQSNGSE